MKTEPFQTAFPYKDPVCDPEEGLSKREYFACAAMQGLLADSTIVDAGKRLTDMAVKIADLLIESLNKPKA